VWWSILETAQNLDHRPSVFHIPQKAKAHRSAPLRTQLQFFNSQTAPHPP
jgi:hypothetical protein